jgi:hypothetical protein
MFCSFDRLDLPLRDGGRLGPIPTIVLLECVLERNDRYGQ